MISLALQGAVLCAVLWSCWKVARRIFMRSSLDELPGPKAESFFKGNFHQIFNLNGWAFHRDMIDNYGGVVGLRGMLGSRMLYVYDPKALHHIIVKDQNVYEETSQFIAENKLIFGEGLLATLGDHHKRQRKLLNPAFSILHMREMVSIFYSVTHRLRDAFEKKVNNKPTEMDVLGWMTRTALELIGQSGFGHSFETLVEGDKPHPFSISCKNLVPAMFDLAAVRFYMATVLYRLGSPRLRRFIVDWMPWPALTRLKNIVDVMDDTAKEIYDEKKQFVEGEGKTQLDDEAEGKKRDLITILMKENMKQSESERLPEDEIIGQIATLVFAAMDTTSGALARVLHLLAEHPHVQDKLREEIKSARTGEGDIPYNQLVDLPYLDAICRETLRLYPPVTMMPRVARQDISLPFSKAIRGTTGNELHEVTVPKGTSLIVSILGANTNPEIWGPDALEWKPERWLSPLPQSVMDAHMPGIYSHLMTFLGGGRACIGFKFSQLEMKAVLAILVETFKFAPSKQEIIWHMTGIATPVVKGDETMKPRLPLILSMA